MANITAAMVKELREKTSAGMMDCKKALSATDGNMEEAVTWLRERGIAKAVKKEGAVAAEGLCSYAIKGNKCVLFELNSQTDFVAQNAKFTALVEQVGNIILASNATNTEEALEVVEGGKTLATIILEASGVIGEKISLRRVQVLTKTDNQVFGAYKHMGGRIVTVSVLNGTNEVVAKDIAMHVAALAPKYVSSQDDMRMPYKTKEIDLPGISISFVHTKLQMKSLRLMQMRFLKRLKIDYMLKRQF